MIVTPHMSLLDLTVESGIPGDVIRYLQTKRILCLFPVMTDFLWIWLMMDLNITCDEDSNKHVTRNSVPTRMPVLKKAKDAQGINSGGSHNENMASDFNTPQFHAINNVPLYYVWFSNTIVA